MFLHFPGTTAGQGWCVQIDVLSWSSADLSGMCQSKCFCNYELEAISAAVSKETRDCSLHSYFDFAGQAKKY